MTGFIREDLRAWNHTVNSKFRLLRGEKKEHPVGLPDCNRKGEIWLEPPVMGAELEVSVKEDAPDINAVRNTWDCFAPSVIEDNFKKAKAKIMPMPSDEVFIVCKGDSSINNGFEIVSSPASIGYHTNAWNKFFTDMPKYFKGATAKSCGMHIHINKWSFTLTAIAKFVSFINTHKDFIRVIGGRDETEFWKFEDRGKKFNRVYKKRVDEGDKYRAVNLGKGGGNTVELRFFASTMDRSTFLKNLQFVYNLRLFCLSTSLAKLSVVDFLEWLYDNKDQHNVYLRHFLEQKTDYMNEYGSSIPSYSKYKDRTVAKPKKFVRR